MTNRSVPTDTILPHLIYDDVAEALSWLSLAFGFAEHYRYGAPDAPQGAQMSLGDAWIMVERWRGDTPPDAQVRTQYLTIFVPDVDAHYQRAKEAGATIFEDLNETVYGERQYGVVDLGRHRWLFSQHVRDANPEEWGAIVADRRGIHGR